MKPTFDAKDFDDEGEGYTEVDDMGEDSGRAWKWGHARDIVIQDAKDSTYWRATLYIHHSEGIQETSDWIQVEPCEVTVRTWRPVK